MINPRSLTRSGTGASRERLRLQLESEGQPGLLPLLEAALGATIEGRYRLDGILAIGRQSFLFEATDLQGLRPVVIKQPNFDYRNPLPYSRSVVERARRVLRVEYTVLHDCTTGHLPKPQALIEAPSPVPAARESALLHERECFLVEERINGRTLTECVLQEWPSWTPAAREKAARGIAFEFLHFWTSLRAAGWHYGDINADNLLIDSDGRLRVVDAGSVVPAMDMIVLDGYTPAFTTPRLLEALATRRPVPSTLATALPPLAKVLHFATTRRQPFNGNVPELKGDVLTRYSTEFREALAALCFLDDHPESLDIAQARLNAWIGKND